MILSPGCLCINREYADLYASINMMYPKDVFGYTDSNGRHISCNAVVFVIAVPGLPPFSPFKPPDDEMHVVYVMAPTSVGWMYMFENEIDSEYSAV